MTRKTQSILSIIWVFLLGSVSISLKLLGFSKSPEISMIVGIALLCAGFLMLGAHMALACKFPPFEETHKKKDQ